MRGFETVFSHRKFEVLRTGKGRYYLKLKGGMRYAAPGLTRITEEEARKVIEEHAARELKRGQQDLDVLVEGEEVNTRGGIAAMEEAKEQERRGCFPGPGYGPRPYGENCGSSRPAGERRWPRL